MFLSKTFNTVRTELSHQHATSYMNQATEPYRGSRDHNWFRHDLRTSAEKADLEQVIYALRNHVNVNSAHPWHV